MYLPKHFSVEDVSRAVQVAQEYPFATVMSFDSAKEACINHLPLLAENTESGLRLIGHMAKQNPQWRHFAGGSKAIIVFNGPHTYITPTWYTSGRDVPTWNYAVVHMEGSVTVTEDFESIITILKKLSERFEKNNSRPWAFELPDDLADPQVLMSAIAGFEIRVEKLEAKFKFSQNRSLEDRRGVIDGLSARPDDMSQRVLQMMKNLFSVEGKQ